VHCYETQKWDGKWNITITEKESKIELSISVTITRVIMKNRSMCRSVFNWQKLPLGSANMVAKKEERKKEKKESGKMTRR
jgi:hypothetical protein